MTIKELSTRAGISVQAVYKRLKQKGVDISTLKDPETGQITPEGEKVMENLFNLKGPSEAAKTPNSTEVERLKTEVEKLTTTVESLTAQVEALTNERDYLRGALDREQQLHAMTLQKVPAALPAGKKRGLLAWFRKGSDE